MSSGELALPKGCYEVKPESGFPKDFFQKRSDWEAVWGENNSLIRSSFDHLTEAALVGKLEAQINSSLKKIDQDTGIAYKVLLAQGRSNIDSRKIVVATSNLLGYDLGEYFAYGGRSEFTCQTGDEHKGFRQASGNIITIILNYNFPAFGRGPLKDPDARVMATDSINAVVEAQKALLLWQAQPEVEAAPLTQDDFDRAISWVLFGDGPDVK